MPLVPDVTAEVSSVVHLRARILMAISLGCVSACGRDNIDRTPDGTDARYVRGTGGHSGAESAGGTGGVTTGGTGGVTTGGTGGLGAVVDYCYGDPFDPSPRTECVPTFPGHGGAAGDDSAGTVECDPLDPRVLPAFYHITLTSMDEEQCCYQITEQCFGRPLLTQSGPRLAPTQLSGEVNGPLTDDATRLGAAWLQVARAEHASVASFQRLGLELLQLGAPLDLIRDAARAALDEIEHTELARGLVHRFLGKTVSFDSLNISDLPLRITLLDVARGTAAEGCIEETLSLVVLQEQRRACRDVGVQAVLDRLIEDETRHVEFSWRLLGWLLDAGDAVVRREVEQVFAREQVFSVPHSLRTTNGHFGELAPARVAEARRLAWRDLVRPCASALLA